MKLNLLVNNVFKIIIIVLFLITSNLSISGNKKSCKNTCHSGWNTRFGLYWNPVAYRNNYIDYNSYGYYEPMGIEPMYPNTYSMFNDYGYWGYPGVYAGYGYPGFGIYTQF